MLDRLLAEIDKKRKGDVDGRYCGEVLLYREGFVNTDGADEGGEEIEGEVDTEGSALGADEGAHVKSVLKDPLSR